MTNETYNRELQEAIEAGERALYSLEKAKEKLNSAENWGIFDMFGGGLFSSMIKHSKMDDAKYLMEDAKRDLQRFQKELKDINVSSNLNMEINNFLYFADFFFDGFLADFMVQSKITEAKNQISDAINRIENILRELR